MMMVMMDDDDDDDDDDDGCRGLIARAMHESQTRTLEENLTLHVARGN